MTREERAFLDLIEGKPDDVTARAVFADWLDDRGRAEEARFFRHVEMTGREFRSRTVASRDDNDYSETGWVAVVVTRGGREYGLLGCYGHCSCYGTWESLCGGGISDRYDPDEVKTPSFDWVGSYAGLVSLAERGVDPTTGRPIVSEEEDGEPPVEGPATPRAEYLREVYREILNHHTWRTVVAAAK